MTTTDTSDTTTAPRRTDWVPALLLASLPVLTIGSMLLIEPLFGDDIDRDHLTQAADLVREQMDGAETEQVSRAVLPMRNASLIAWVDYDTDDWSMCLFTPDGSPTAEGSNHLIFSAKGEYLVQPGSCPDTPRLDLPEPLRMSG